MMPYYEAGIAISTWVCENCGAYIPNGQGWQRITAQAHILDKEKYESVRGCILNRLHLCGACHMDWDSSWHKAARMAVFPLAQQRLETFRHQVTEPLPEIFNIQNIQDNLKHEEN